jgi:hypothetical protein
MPRANVQKRAVACSSFETIGKAVLCYPKADVTPMQQGLISVGGVESISYLSLCYILSFSFCLPSFL